MRSPKAASSKGYRRCINRRPLSALRGPSVSPFCSLVVKGARMASWWFTRSCIVSLTGGPDGGGA